MLMQFYFQKEKRIISSFLNVKALLILIIVMKSIQNNKLKQRNNKSGHPEHFLSNILHPAQVQQGFKLYLRPKFLKHKLQIIQELQYWQLFNSFHKILQYNKNDLPQERKLILNRLIKFRQRKRTQYSRKLLMFILRNNLIKIRNQEIKRGISITLPYLKAKYKKFVWAFLLLFQKRTAKLSASNLKSLHYMTVMKKDNKIFQIKNASKIVTIIILRYLSEIFKRLKFSKQEQIQGIQQVEAAFKIKNICLILKRKIRWRYKTVFDKLFSKSENQLEDNPQIFVNIVKHACYLAKKTNFANKNIGNNSQRKRNQVFKRILLRYDRNLKQNLKLSFRAWRQANIYYKCRIINRINKLQEKLKKLTDQINQ